MPAAKKLIEVALPLDAINKASAREKSIRHGHPSTLHLRWSRKPLATTRAVIFTSLVDDPDDPNANPAFVAACKKLNYGATNEEIAALKEHTEKNRERRLRGQSAIPFKRNIPQNARDGNDSPRMRLFDFIERLVQWKSTTDEAIMGQARELIRIATNGNPPPLLDPFAGGGSIPLEAQRLGLEAHASDLNPVAVMINKAMIEIPPRFANMPPVNPRDRKDVFAGGSTPPEASGRGSKGGSTTWKGAAGLAADVRYYGEWMRESAFEKIGHLYPKHNGETVIAWLWARTVISPNSAVNAPVPLASSFALSKKAGRERWAKPVIEGTSVRFEVTQGKPPQDADGTIGKRKFGGGRCIVSGEPMSFEYVRSEGKAGRMGTMPMAIVTQGKKGRSYYNFDHIQETCAAEAENMDNWKPAGKMPLNDPHFPTGYGIYEFADLFTPRQLVALTTFSDLVQEARELATQDALQAGLADDDVPLRDAGTGARAYGEAIHTYLSIALNRVVMGCNSLSRWNSTGQKVQHCFGRQALPMIWDFADPNPFTESTGSWVSGYKYVSDPLDMGGITPVGLGFGSQVDAMDIEYRDRVILSTDPPYYDNIGYADLSDFFYVWMRKSLRSTYPDIFATILVPKTRELIASAYRHSSKGAAKEFFESGMLKTFRKIRDFVIDEYPITVYYAFKQQDAGHASSGQTSGTSSTGWETMLESLIQSGFSISGTWPIRTEMRTRLVGRDTNALASSIVLVCRPRPDDAPSTSRRRFLDALRAEIPAAIAEMRTGKILPVDLAQASIGPGMAIYSRYSAVLEADGDPVSVRAALSLINTVLAETLYEFVGDVDEYTRFAFDWFQQHQFEAGNAGTAETLAMAKNTSLPGLQRAGLIELGGGKVRLLHWQDYDPGAYDPQQDDRATVWEGAHHLIERLNSHGETGAAMLLTKMSPELAGAAQDLAFSLYDICERNGWARHARDYNGLIASWQGSDGIASEAARLRSEPEQPELQLDLD